MSENWSLDFNRDRCSSGNIFVHSGGRSKDTMSSLRTGSLVVKERRIDLRVRDDRQPKRETFVRIVRLDQPIKNRRAQCPERTPRLRFLARSSRRMAADQCPLSRVMQTSQFKDVTSAFDPKRTISFAALCFTDLQRPICLCGAQPRC
jgi:hypothetical protein